MIDVTIIREKKREIILFNPDCTEEEVKHLKNMFPDGKVLKRKFSHKMRTEGEVRILPCPLYIRPTYCEKGSKIRIDKRMNTITLFAPIFPKVIRKVKEFVRIHFLW